MATEASRLRLQVARRAALAYGEEEGVVAVVCAGSTARGTADRWSDLELCVVWRVGPEDWARRRAIEAVGGRASRLLPYDRDSHLWEDEWWHEGDAGAGLLVEVSHLNSVMAEADVKRLVKGRDWTEGMLTFAEAMTRGSALAGAELISRWAGQLLPYPRPLAASVVRRLGQIDHFWRWQMLTERSNPLERQAHLAAVARSVLHQCYALSGVFWPGSKSALRGVEALRVAPPRLAARLWALPSADPAAAAADLARLVEETYDLVEVQLPEVDVKRLRAIFRFERRPWPPAVGA